MKLGTLFVAILLTVTAYAQECANDLKVFQTCIETFAAENPPEKPSPPPVPDRAEFLERVGECFTSNDCQDPTTDLTSSPSPRMPSGFPHRRGRPGVRPSSRGPPPSPEQWHEMKKAKWECLDKIAKEDFEPVIQACVQEEIAGWTFPVKPANKSVIFDPYGEGPLGKYAMIMRFKRRHKGGPGPPPSINEGPRRGRRHSGPRRPPFGGPPPHKGRHDKVDQKIASAIFDEETCPKASREGVTSCLMDLAKEMHQEMINNALSPLEKMIKKFQNHDAFCENRQSCFDKISEGCRNDFWDQKWYMARCFQQHTDTMEQDDWDSVDEKFEECMTEAGFSSTEEPVDDEEEEKEASDDEAKEKIQERQARSASSEEIGGPFGQKSKIRRCISRRFQDGHVKNPCRKIGGMYQMMMSPGGPGRGRHGPHPPHRRGPPRHHFGMGPPHRHF